MASAKLELGNRVGYYMGRFTVGDIDKSKTTTMFDVAVDADPYRLEARKPASPSRWWQSRQT